MQNRLMKWVKDAMRVQVLGAPELTEVVGIMEPIPGAFFLGMYASKLYYGANDNNKVRAI